MFAENNHHETGDTRVARFWLVLLILAVPLLMMLGGCSSGPAVPAAGTTEPALVAAETLSMTAMEEILQAELIRLGKATMQAGEYSPPMGETNSPFDLHALLIDPDGEGGLDPQGVQLRWTERLIGDYNMDGLVNASDLTPLGQYYGETVDYLYPADAEGINHWPTDYNLHKPLNGYPNWRLARIDGNGDGLINMQDITPIGQHWQEQLSGYRFEVSRSGSAGWEPVMDPRDESRELFIPFGWSPVLDGIEYYEQFVNEYRINLPISITAGDTIRFIPVNASGSAGLTREVECEYEFPWWIQYYNAQVYTSQGPWAIADWFRSQGEIVKVAVTLVEEIPGDADASGAVDMYDMAPLERFADTSIDDYTGAERELFAHADLDGSGSFSVSDLTQIGSNWGSRLDGYAFSAEGGIMNPDDPTVPFVMPRPFKFDIQNIPGWYEFDLPVNGAFREIRVMSVMCGDTEITYGDLGPLNPHSFTEMSAPFDTSDPVVAMISTGTIERRFGHDINLGAAASFCNVGEITTYEWDLDDDGTFEATGVEQTVTPDTVGDYTYTLRVSNNLGDRAEVELTITVD